MQEREELCGCALQTECHCFHIQGLQISVTVCWRTLKSHNTLSTTIKAERLLAGSFEPSINIVLALQLTITALIASMHYIDCWCQSSKQITQRLQDLVLWPNNTLTAACYWHPVSLNTQWAESNDNR